MNKDRSGDAFPTPAVYTTEDAVCAWTGCNGLSKREYFAALALQGLLGCTGVHNTIGEMCSHIPAGTIRCCSALAVAYADALLAELAKEKP